MHDLMQQDSSIVAVASMNSYMHTCHTINRVCFVPAAVGRAGPEVRGACTHCYDSWRPASDLLDTAPAATTNVMPARTAKYTALQTARLFGPPRLMLATLIL
jgi:hypothetical protein